MSAPHASRTRSSPTQHAASNPDDVGVGVGQCRLGQDPRAGAARHPPAARRHRSGENPVPHLHQGRGRQHGEPHVRRRWRAWTDARRRRARRRDRARPAAQASDAKRRARRGGCSRWRWRRRAASRCRPSTRFCTRLLHQFPFEANVAARFRVLEETQQQQIAGATSAATVLLEAARQPGQRRSAGRWRRSSRSPATSRSRTCSTRRSASANEIARMARRTPAALDAAHGAALARRSGSSPDDTLPKLSRPRSSTGRICRSSEWARRRRSARKAPRATRRRPRGCRDALAAAGAGARSRPISRCSAPTKVEPRKTIITSAVCVKHQADLARPSRRRAGARRLAAAKSAAPSSPATAPWRCSPSRMRRHRPLHAREKDSRGLLDYDDLIDTAPARCSTRVERRLGALQARPRHRPSADRRGAGHQPGAVGHHQALRRRIHHRRGRARHAAALDLRGRRRQAVDLLVPGRGAGRVRATRATSSRPRTRARSCRSTRSRSSIRSARRRRCWRRSMTVFKQPAAHAGLTTDPDSDRARSGARGRARPGRTLAAGRARTRSPRSIPGTRRSTKLRRPARASSSRGRSPPQSGAGSTRGDLVGDGDKRHPVRPGDILDSGAPARRAVRGGHPRAEGRRRSGRRRRPAAADRAHRGDGSAGAGRRAAAAATTIWRWRRC